MSDLAATNCGCGDEDADVITTVAVAMETVFLEITPVIVFSGSSV